MFSKKKKPQISNPTNFQHRVHTGYDKKEGKYIGLPLQWASIVGNNQILKSSNRPVPLVDPSSITHTEILDLKTIVRPQSSLATSIGDNSITSSLLGHELNNPQNTTYNGFNLPKISHVARSNSLRCSSPPRNHREPQIPNSVQEETPQQMNQLVHPINPGQSHHQQQYPLALIHQIDPNVRKMQPQPHQLPQNVPFHPNNNNNSLQFNGKAGQAQQQSVYGNLQQNAPNTQQFAAPQSNVQGPLQLQQHHFQQKQFEQQQQQQQNNNAPLRLNQDIVNNNNNNNINNNNNNPSRGSVTSSANSMGGEGRSGGLQLPLNQPQSHPGSMNGANGKQEQRLTHEQFRAALQMVVSQGDPRENLENFVKIGEGSTGTVWIALEKNTSKLICIPNIVLILMSRIFFRA